MAKGCPACEKYGTIECHRRSRPAFDKLTKKQLLEIIDDLLNHHKGGNDV